MTTPHAHTNGSNGVSAAVVTASQQEQRQPPQQQQQQLLPLLKHIEAFVKIVNVSQTLQLHEWNVESLQRALQWARFLERGTRRYDAQQQHQLDALLRETFPVMSLPSFAKGDVMTTHTLQNASQHLTRSLLQSAFLSSHPSRSELLLFILRHAAHEPNEPNEPNEPAATNETVDISAVLADRTVWSQKRSALTQIARAMSIGCERVRVEIGTFGAVSIASQTSYLLHPRTLELRAVAKSLQANAISAFVLTATVGRSDSDAKTPFVTFVTGLKQKLQTSTSLDVLEVSMLTVAGIEWPLQYESAVRNVIETSVLAPALAAAPHWLSRLPPWLCAMLAGQSATVRKQYIATLTTNGFLEPQAQDFATRVATLVLTSDDAARDVTSALEQIEPLVLKRFFCPSISSSSSTTSA